MNTEQHIYCVFCETQRAEAIAGLINQVLPARCISPKIVQRYWKQGREEHRIHQYLPGYLFVFSEETIESFRDIFRFAGVIRVLGDKENGNELEGSDRIFAQMLLDTDGTLGILKAVQEGDQVRLAGELYHGFAGEIVRLDKRKGRAQIRFNFDGHVQNVWVGYDLIQAAEDRNPEAEADETE